MAQRNSSPTFWSETDVTPPPAGVRLLERHPLLLGVAALAVAAATCIVLPGSSFRAKAVVAIVEPTSPLAVILTRTASDAAVSKPVMGRAAESLIGTGFPVPEPDLAERAAVTAHLGAVTATGKTARLAAHLSRLVVARPGEMPGSLDIIAATGEADQAPQAASAVADALIADQDETIAKARRKRDLDGSAKLERLKAEAATARRQLAAFGGEEADPVQALAAAIAQTARAQARFDAIRAIIASGSPPLSDRRDVPAAIETAQSAYLDLSRQLAKARETLGERHTTIIGLNADLRHAAASLTAEWRRLSRMAEADFDAAREREGKLRKAGGGTDAKRRDAMEEARRNLQTADDAVARALAAMREAAADERGYRLVARPVVPNAASGLSLISRLLIGAAAGLLVAGLGLLVSRRRFLRAAPTLVAMPDVVMPIEERAVAIHETAEATERAEPAAQTQLGGRAPTQAAHAEASRVERDQTESPLLRAMSDLLPDLEAIDPNFGPIPTVMIASNEAKTEVAPVALALGRAAADKGLRVLLVEATRARKEIASAADADADPILVDLFGRLRVAFRAKASDGALFLALSLQDGARIASALARDEETLLVDDIGAEFDLVVIDGGRAADAAAAGWGADAFVRVGRYRAKRDDDQFVAAFGVPRDAILGAVVASTFLRTPAQPIISAVGADAPDVVTNISRLPLSHAARMRHAPPRRRIAAR